MSTEAVVRFRDAVNQSEALQRELRGLEEFTPDTVSELAARHGYACTPDEILSVAGSLLDELTEFELEMVAGGTDEREVACWRQGMRGAEDVAPGYGLPTEHNDEPGC